MAGSTIEWLVFFLFVVLFVVSVAAEIFWLVKNGWSTGGRATAFVLITDIIGFCIGGLIALIAFFVMFMMVMGPAGTGGSSPEAAYWLVTAIAVIVPPILLILLKRIFLLIFQIGVGKAAWMFSIVSSLLVLIVVLIPPPAVFYLIAKLWK